MALKVGDLVAELSLDSSKFQRGSNQVSNRLTALATSFVAFRQAASDVGRALAAVARNFVDLAERGGQVTNVQAAFTRATGNAAEALRTLRGATRGLLTDYDLMVGFNRAVALGSARTADEFATLSRTAIALGRALGVNATFALESLNLGIGRQSRLILDNLGIIVRAEDAYKRYAAAVNKTVAELTEQEKREAFRTAAMQAAQRTLGELGEGQLTAADGVARLRTATGNLRDSFAKIITQTPSLIAAFDGIANAINNIAKVVALAGPAIDGFLLAFRTMTGTIFRRGTPRASAIIPPGVVNQIMLMPQLLQTWETAQARVVAEQQKTNEELEETEQAITRIAGFAFPALFGAMDQLKRFRSIFAIDAAPGAPGGAGPFAALFEMGTELERRSKLFGAEIKDAVQKPLQGISKDVRMMAHMLGMQIVMGILDGVKSMEDLLKNVLKSLIAAAVSIGIRSALGIASPSKVTREFGRLAGLGFALGMEDVQPRIAQGAQTMGMAALQGAAVGPTNINIATDDMPESLTPQEAALNRWWLRTIGEINTALGKRGHRFK